MRIWDLPTSVLCRQHLLGEHRELHAIWRILVDDRRGYRNHPEVKRWEGRLQWLVMRHEAQVAEMSRRGYRHRSALDGIPFWGYDIPEPSRINSLQEQRELLRSKGCECEV